MAEPLAKLELDPHLGQSLIDPRRQTELLMPKPMTIRRRGSSTALCPFAAPLIALQRPVERPELIRRKPPPKSRHQTCPLPPIGNQTQTPPDETAGGCKCQGAVAREILAVSRSP
jgi:hypothetical protein